jgi:hypothetical protein
MSVESKRDYYAGGLIVLIGAAATYQGSQYGIGTLAQMESGFFPTLIGVGMMVVGAAIALSGSTATGPATTGLEDPHLAAPSSVDWRGWIAIIAGDCLFMILSEYAGLLPAIFACVFVSAIGSRTTTWKEGVVLAACVTVFGIALFYYGLKIQIPIWRGL